MDTAIQTRQKRITRLTEEPLTELATLYSECAVTAVAGYRTYGRVSVRRGKRIMNYRKIEGVTSECLIRQTTLDRA